MNQPIPEASDSAMGGDDQEAEKPNTDLIPEPEFKEPIKIDQAKPGEDEMDLSST